MTDTRHARDCQCPECNWWVINKNGALLIKQYSKIVRNEALVSGPYATKASAKAAWAEILDREVPKK